jgi:hypothetical protein
MMPIDWFGGGFGIWFLLVAAVNIAFVVAIIAGIIVGVRWLMRQNAGPVSRPIQGR